MLISGMGKSACTYSHRNPLAIDVASEGQRFDTLVHGHDVDHAVLDQGALGGAERAEGLRNLLCVYVCMCMRVCM